MLALKISQRASGHEIAAMFGTTRGPVYQLRVGSTLASGKIHGYRLTTICAFKLPGTDPVVTFGDTPLDRISLDHIEAFQDARKADGLSAVAVNHDRKLLGEPCAARLIGSKNLQTNCNRASDPTRNQRRIRGVKILLSR